MLSQIRTGFPRQRISTREKTDKWAKECVDAAVKLVLYNDQNQFESKEDMDINDDLYNGILNKKDTRKIMDPWELGGRAFPDEVQIFSICKSKVDLLVGEETRRKFDWRVRVTNDDAISEKERMIKEHIMNSLMNLVVKEGLTEEQIAAEVKKLDKWKKYEAQDFRERLGSQILTHLYQEQNLKLKFNHGFKDALKHSMEIYHVDIVGKKPILRKIDPRTIYFTGLTDSTHIEDADMIVEESYMSIGAIIDYYYDDLKPGDIDKLQGNSKAGDNQLINYPGADNPVVMYANMADGSIDLDYNPKGIFNNYGDVRVRRVSWRSLRKLGELKYYDEDGLPAFDTVDENYKPDITRGEEITWMWINEWWSGVQIAEDIYIRMKPNDVQFRRMDNLSMCSSGYVGTIYGNRSMMSIMRPFEYMYSFLMHRLKKIYARYYGPMVEMDFAKMPDSWTPEKWLMWAQEMGYLMVDSFTEGQKGAAQGKLGGSFNTTGRVLNVDLGNYIQQTIGLLQYIETELGSVVGITRQREGSIDNRETVGGVERSVTQSSHITEELFLLHDNTKLRALQALLEVAKFAYRDVNNKVAQYVLDGDLSQTIFNIDGESFMEADYGIVLTDSSNYVNMMNVIQQLTQAGLQNQKLNFSSVLDIFLSPSFVDARRKIEQYEEEFDVKMQQQQEGQQQHEKEMLEMEIANKEDVQAHQMEIELLKSNTQIEMKLMELESRMSEGVDVEDNTEEFELQKEKIRKELDLKEKQLHETIRTNKKGEEQKDKELTIREKVANKPVKTTKK